jgi:hypothetical protein
MALWVFLFLFFAAFDSEFEMWNGKGNSSWLEWVSPESYNVAEDFNHSKYYYRNPPPF